MPGNAKWMPEINEKVTKLEVKCTEYNKTELEEYLRYIDDNLSKSITEITFIACEKDPTSQWKNIFTKVEKLHLRSRGVSTVENVNIHRFFPNIRVLEVDTFAFTDISVFVYNFSHLEELLYNSRAFDRSQKVILDFFRNILPFNHQIKRIFLMDQFDEKVLQLINELLPNLQQLDLYGNSFDLWEPQTKNPVRFKNVKRISLHLGQYGARENIYFAFDQLEEITEFYDTGLSPKWIDWIVQNTQLKRLSINQELVQYFKWSNLVEKLPNLVEVSGVLWTEFIPRDNQVAGLLTEENKLKRVSVHVHTVEECEKLSELSHLGWDIVDEDHCKSNKSMTFVR